MSKIEYLRDIAHATTARQLHNLKNQAATDGELDPAEQSAVNIHISKQFARMNQNSVRHQPRWSAAH